MKALVIVAALAVVVVVLGVLARHQHNLRATATNAGEKMDKVTIMDPSQVLYSLATICDRMAPLESPGGGPTDVDLSIHEDDWRQIEFVPAIDSEYIASKLAELRQFKVDHRKGAGWTRIFIRPDHPTDFGIASLRFSALRQILAARPGRLFIFQSWSAPVETAGQVPGGFSFRVGPHFSVYGFEGHDIVRALGIHIDRLDNTQLDLDSACAALSAIARQAELEIVDWYQCKTVAPDSESEVRAWLTPHM
jgi:hypothetical protein